MITERAASVSIKSRYYEIINPQKVDTRTGDEIVEDILSGHIPYRGYFENEVFIAAFIRAINSIPNNYKITLKKEHSGDVCKFWANNIHNFEFI